MDLLESKDHLINKLNITSEEKQTLIDFFKSRPDLENKVDWNNKDLGIDDFNSVLLDKSNNESKKTGDIVSLYVKKRNGDPEDLYVYKETSSDLYVAPFCHKAAEFLNSHHCFGTGAKWCIGTAGNVSWWNDYTDRGCLFLMWYEKPYKNKYVLQWDPYGGANGTETGSWTLFDAADDTVKTFAGDHFESIPEDNEERFNRLCKYIHLTPQEVEKIFQDIEDAGLRSEEEDEDN